MHVSTRRRSFDRPPRPTMSAASLDAAPLPRLQFDDLPSRDRDAQTIPTPPPDSPLTTKRALRVSRALGDSELSYFLPSRADGVNDMCVGLLAAFRESLRSS